MTQTEDGLRRPTRINNFFDLLIEMVGTHEQFKRFYLDNITEPISFISFFSEWLIYEGSLTKLLESFTNQAIRLKQYTLIIEFPADFVDILLEHLKRVWPLTAKVDQIYKQLLGRLYHDPKRQFIDGIPKRGLRFSAEQIRPFKQLINWIDKFNTTFLPHCYHAI